MSVEGQQGDSSSGSVSTPQLVNDQAMLPDNGSDENLIVEASDKPVVEAPPKVQTIDDKLSSKFAALSRKEKAIKQQEMQFKQTQSEMQKQLADLKAENERLLSEHSGYKTKIKERPLQTLKEEGLTFEQLTEMQLNDENPTTEMLMKKMREELSAQSKSELEALKKELADEKAKAESELQERTVSGYKKQIMEHVTSNADKYELINLNDAAETVFSVVEQFYENEGRILSVEEAADYVEKHFEDEANKILNAKKFAAKRVAIPPKPSEKPASLTLSNELSAEVPKGNSRMLSRDEQIEEAAKLIRWES